MFSPALTARIESACLRAVETLEQVLANAESDTVKVNASLGLLRLAERVATRLAPAKPKSHRRAIDTDDELEHELEHEPDPNPASPTSGCDADTNTDIPIPPHARTYDATDPDNPNPLSPAEVHELASHYGVDPDDVRAPARLIYWRRMLYYVRLYKGNAKPP